MGVHHKGVDPGYISPCSARQHSHLPSSHWLLCVPWSPTPRQPTTAATAALTAGKRDTTPCCGATPLDHTRDRATGAASSKRRSTLTRRRCSGPSTAVSHTLLADTHKKWWMGTSRLQTGKTSARMMTSCKHYKHSPCRISILRSCSRSCSAVIDNDLGSRSLTTEQKTIHNHCVRYECCF